MKGKTFTTALVLAALALVLIPGLVVRRTVVSVSRIGMSLEEPNLLVVASTSIRKPVSHD